MVGDGLELPPSRGAYELDHPDPLSGSDLDARALARIAAGGAWTWTKARWPGWRRTAG